MGFTTRAKVVCVVFMTTLLCFSLLTMLPDMKVVSGDKTMHGTNFRKVLYALKDKEKKLIINGNRNGIGNMKKKKEKKKKSAVEMELRAAPLGPDPLHHNGGSPRKKPTTMP